MTVNLNFAVVLSPHCSSGYVTVNKSPELCVSKWSALYEDESWHQGRKGKNDGLPLTKFWVLCII